MKLLIIIPLLFFPVTDLFAANQARLTESRWREPVCLAEKANSWDIAWFKNSVHVVWIADEKMYWQQQVEEGKWTTPVVISVRAVGYPDLVAGRDKLHLTWLQKMNVGYKFFNGSSWTVEESVFSELRSVHGPRLAVCDNRPVVFYSHYEFGLIPHTPGSYPLSVTYREDGAWHTPYKVPAASNVSGGHLSVLAKSNDAIHLVWVQEHRSYLYRNFGLGAGAPLRTLEYLCCDKTGAETGSSFRLGKLSKSITRLCDLAADSEGALAVAWIDGSSDAKGVSLRISKCGPSKGWYPLHLFSGDKRRRPYYATVLSTPQTIVLVINVEEETASRKIEAILLKEDREINRCRSSFDWLLDLPRSEVSPDGTVHLLGNRYKMGLSYCKIQPGL